MRKFKWWYATGIAVWCLLTSVVVLAGHEVGNGVDNKHPSLGSAWFIGEDKTVRYCVVYDKDFGATLETAERELSAAFSTWENYYLPRRGMAPEEWPNAFIATKFRKIDTCDGTEDLTFFFGAEDPRVLQYREQFASPAAFSSRISYDAAQGWSKGLVWLAKSKTAVPELNFPNWSDPANIHGALLHEVGHIYGNDHVKGTIMDDTDLFFLLALGAEADPQYEKVLRSVDHYRQLTRCWDCSIVWRGTLGRFIDGESFKSYPKENEEKSRHVFRLLTGREPVGKISATVYSQYYGKVQQLIVTDERASHQFAILLDLKGFRDDLRRSFAPLAGNAFHIYLEKRKSDGEITGTLFLLKQSDAWVEFATLQTATGKTLTLILENSLGSRREGPLTIKFFDEGRVEYLFWMSFLNEGERGSSASEIGGKG